MDWSAVVLEQVFGQQWLCLKSILCLPEISLVLKYAQEHRKNEIVWHTRSVINCVF